MSSYTIQNYLIVDMFYIIIQCSVILIFGITQPLLVTPSKPKCTSYVYIKYCLSPLADVPILFKFKTFTVSLTSKYNLFLLTYFIPTYMFHYSYSGKRERKRCLPF